MKEIYLNLIQLITSLTIFKEVMVYNAQVDRIRAGLISFNTPTLFIEIRQYNTENLGRNINTTDLSIRMHIVMTELDAGNGTLDQNLNIFQIRDTLNKLIINYTPPTCSAISYTNEFQEYKHTNLYHYVSYYKCHYFDYTAFNPFVPIYPYFIWDQTDITWEQMDLLWDLAKGPLLNLSISEG